MRPRPGTPFYALALLVAAAAAADPRFDVVPAGVKELSGDGCVAVSEYGVRWQNGASMPIAEGISFSGNDYSTIGAMTPDVSVIVLSHHAGGYGRLENGESTPLALPPSSWVAEISDDGARLLLNDWTANSTSLWMDGVSEPLAPIPSPTPSAWASALSADASRVGGTSRDETGNYEAVIWDRAQGTLVRLGKLAGHTRSQLFGLSADGNVAVGQSWNDEEIRAFRWDGSALFDLGPLATHAMATNADGSVVVGRGPDGAFIWDAQHGTRLLRDVLEQDYQFDLGGVWLDEASLVSDDGKTIAGRSSAGSGGWRARLRDERCGSAPPADLLWDQDLSDFARPSSLAVDSQQRVYAAGRESRNVIRLDGAQAQFPPTEAVEVLDLKDTALPGASNDFPIVLGVGPNDAVYVSAFARQQILRIDPDGSVTLVFDGSGLPPVESQGGPLATSALSMAVAPDGTLFVAAWARLLRIDPDGQVQQVLDALDLAQHQFGPDTTLATAFISYVAWFPSSLAVADGWGRVFMVLPDGSIFEDFDARDFGVQSLRRLTPDLHGGLWLSGEGLGVRRPDGLLEPIFEYWAPEEISGTAYGRTWGLIAEPRGSLLYTDGARLVRREADGSSQQLLTSGSPTAFGPLQSIGATLLHAGNSLYWTTEWPENRIVRYEFDIAACENGLDDDGDGAADFPTDAGCSSAQDDGEIPEPEAVAMLVAGAVLLAGLDRRRARRMRASCRVQVR